MFSNNTFTNQGITIYKIGACCLFMEEFYGLTLQKFDEDEKNNLVYCVDITCFQRLLVHAPHQRV